MQSTIEKQSLEQAALDFREFVVEGFYAKKGQYEKNTIAAKAMLRDRLHSSDQKRHEYTELGWVAKFMPKQRRAIDHAAIIEELLCYIKSEALSQTITFNKKRMDADGATSFVENYMYPPTYYIKATLNKLGKQFGDAILEDYNGVSEMDLIRSIEFNTTRKKELEERHTKLLVPFRTMEEQKFNLDIGSISKIANRPVYDVHKIYETFGLEFLIEYGEVKTGAIEEWIGIKAIPHDILSRNSIVEEITLDFTVMTLQAEENAFNAFKRFREYRYLIV